MQNVSIDTDQLQAPKSLKKKHFETFPKNIGKLTEK